MDLNSRCVMTEQWINLTNLPAHGREFSFEDQEFWREIWQEFHDDYEILQPFSATLTFAPQSDGYLIRGRLRGTVATACHRCTEPARVDISQNFDSFEAFEDADVLEGEESYLRNTDNGWELNIFAMLREECLLAMPEKILCRDACLGLCPQCGKNRNLEPCSCSDQETLSPLARALQGVKIKNN